MLAKCKNVLSVFVYMVHLIKSEGGTFVYSFVDKSTSLEGISHLPCDLLNEAVELQS